MPVIEVADADDPRLADYRHVPDPELLRTGGAFVAEGRLVVRRLLASRFTTRSLLLTSTALAAMADLGPETLPVPVYVVPQAVMTTLTGFHIHRGCLAIGERVAPPPVETLLHDATTVVVLEGVGNADNVGGIFRSAAALGAGAVLLGPSCADPLYRKAIRTSMGAALALPFARLGPWPDALTRVRDQGFTVLALTPGASLTLEACRPHLDGQRVAILAGHEGEGLSPEALAHAGLQARIPMTGAVDSLNVATAVAIALYGLHPPGRVS